MRWRTEKNKQPDSFSNHHRLQRNNNKSMMHDDVRLAEGYGKRLQKKSPCAGRRDLIGVMV